MTPITRLVRTAVLFAGPALLAARVARAVAGRTTSAIRGSEREPVAGPLFAAPKPAVKPVPTFARPAAATPATAKPAVSSSSAAPTAAATSKPAPPAVAAEDVPVYSSDLPIASYDALNVRDASTAIKELTDPEQVRLILRFEEENAKRTTVHKVARVHLESLEGATRS